MPRQLKRIRGLREIREYLKKILLHNYYAPIIT